MSEWQEVLLGEVVDFQNGGGFKASEFTEGGIPVVRVSDFTDDSVDISNCKFLSSVSLPTYEKFLLKKDDVVVSTVGSHPANPTSPVGKVVAIPAEANGCFLNQNAVRLRAIDCVTNQGFVRYLAKTDQFKHHISIHARGSANHARIAIGMLKEFKFKLPPLPTQRRIAEILGRLDDKIELNRRINRTLEAMAQALFRHHFVDFGPYQDELVESEAGLIPRGWEMAPLSSHIKVAKGLSYKGQWLANEGMPLHNLNSIYEGGGYKYEGIKFYVGEYQERHTVKPGDLIIANTEQGFEYLLIGCPAIVPKRFGEMGLFTHHIYKVELLPNSPLTTHYVYFWIKNPQLRQAVTAFTNGTTVNMLSRDGLQIPLMAVPPSEIVQSFDRVVSHIMRQIEHNEDENRKLAEIRDYLLPRLLSGQVNVI